MPHCLYPFLIPKNIVQLSRLVRSMAVSFSGMPTAASVFAAYAAVSAYIVLLQTLFNQLVPHQLRTYLLTKLRNFFLKPKPSPNLASLVIEESDGISTNDLFSAAETYLSTKIRSATNRLKISKRRRDAAVSLRFAQSETIPDSFDGIDLEWRFISEEKKKGTPMTPHPGDDYDHDQYYDYVTHSQSEKRFFELRFDGKHKDKVIDSYFPFVLESSRRIVEENKVVMLHTLSHGMGYGGPSRPWDSINLDHPFTFDTLAMDPTKKEAIIADLDRFVRRKDFYSKVGKAWKRGYLLYGPPGTGKSSLIAAMANYLKFDIYDLELTNIMGDSDLRTLLLRTPNRSILVIEDIDCTVELPDRSGGQMGSFGGPAQYYSPHPPRDQFTLSGLLNFIDGLWSSCGDERIIVFTTNNKDKLDPALLRPGRMDMHIHMSYLTPHGFRLLASTYLGLDHHDDHPRLAEIDDLIKTMNVTPAQVAEELMKSDDVDASLDALVDFLESKKKKNEDDTNDDELVVMNDWKVGMGRKMGRRQNPIECLSVNDINFS